MSLVETEYAEYLMLPNGLKTLLPLQKTIKGPMILAEYDCYQLSRLSRRQL